MVFSSHWVLKVRLNYISKALISKLELPPCRLSPRAVFVFAAKFVDEQDLSDVLGEFDAVIEDFTSPVEKRHFRYDEHLKTVKRRSSASVSDSGISDTESECARSVRRKLINFICLTPPTVTSGTPCTLRKKGPK